MIEQRKLTRKEVAELINDAPDTETRNLVAYIKELNLDAYDFFNIYGIENDGIVSDGRPIYIGILTKNSNREHELWTVVNSNVKEQFSLFKLSKRQVSAWSKKYGNIYATMEKTNPQNIKWTERLGFKRIEESDNLITFKLNGGI